MHNQAHGGMDVATHLEGPGARKGFVKHFAGRLLLGIEQPIDIDLMDETVLVGEGDAFIAGDGDFPGPESAAAGGQEHGETLGRSRAPTRK